MQYTGIAVSEPMLVLLQFQQALERVRAGADVMPKRQLEQVIVAEAGPDWRSKVASFEDEPLAAASIGQVSTFFLALFCNSNYKIVYITIIHISFNVIIWYYVSF